MGEARIGERTELFGLALLGLLGALSLSMVSPILPQYVEHFGVSYVGIGFFFTAYSLTWVLLQLYTGYLSDKYGKKNFIFLGLLIYGIVAFLLGSAQTFAQLLIFRVLQGVGLGIYGPAALGLVAQFREKSRRLAFYRSANGAGIIIGPILGGFAASFDLSYPFFLSGFVSLAGVLALRCLKEEKIEERTSFVQSLKDMLLEMDILLICLSAFLAELCFAALDIVIPLVGSSLGFSSLWIGAILASYFLMFTASQVPIAVLSERVERRKLIASAAFAGTVPFVILHFSSGPLEMALALGLLGISLGAVFVQSSAMIAELAPKGKESLYMALFDGIIDFSFPVIPLVLACLATFGVKTPFILLVTLMVLSGTLFLSLKLPKRPH